jgi:membrane protease subunit (stomatin/prohibitin family)
MTFTTSSSSANITMTSLNSNTNTPEGPNIRNLKSKKSIETGRVEKGEKSKQKFTNSYEQFNYHTSHQVSLKILPLSNKNKTTEEIKHYCTECGTKTKSKYKFCPTCGNKL